MSARASWLPRTCTTLAFVTLASGCGSLPTATIYRTPRRHFEARIESGDASALHVRHADGTALSLAPSEVSAIDHPGDVQFFVGAGLLALGLWSLLPTYSDDTQRSESDLGIFARRLVGFMFTFSGGLSMIGGGAVWAHSRSAADGFEPAAP